MGFELDISGKPEGNVRRKNYCDAHFIQLQNHLSKQVKNVHVVALQYSLGAQNEQSGTRNL